MIRCPARLWLATMLEFAATLYAVQRPLHGIGELKAIVYAPRPTLSSRTPGSKITDRL